MMNIEEKAMHTILIDRSFEITGGILRLNENNFRFGEGENTKEGTWYISMRGNDYYVVTLNPDLGKILVDLDLRKV